MNKIILDNDDRDFLLWRDGSGDTIEIFDIAVGSERGVGKGRRLIELLFEQLHAETRVFAITRATNLVAQQFYEKLRFDVVGVLRRFYSGNMEVDAVMYGRKAGGSV